MKKGAPEGAPGRRIYQRQGAEIGGEWGLDAKRGKKRPGVFGRTRDGLQTIRICRILRCVYWPQFPLPGS